MMDFVSLNNYIKVSKIGSGSFGDVYKIKEKQSGEILAAKVSLHSLDESIDNYRFSIIDFEREITIISKIHHPLILNFVGLSMHNFKGENKPTIITDYLPNGSLEDILKKSSNDTSSKEWNDINKLIVIYGIASAMSFLNSHNIIHLDLKPSHILLDENLHPVISDFGFSLDLKRSSFTSQFYDIRGTPLYVSPEVWEDSNYSKKSDVYSYALILYQILTNETPFKKMSLYQLTQAVCEGERPDVSLIKEPYKGLIERCWDQKPEKRPSFDQIIDELETNKEFITNTIDEDEFLKFVGYIKNCQKSFDDDVEPFILSEEIIRAIKYNPIEIINNEDYDSLEKEIEFLRMENHRLKERNVQLTDENNQLKSSLSPAKQKSVEIQITEYENGHNSEDEENGHSSDNESSFKSSNDENNIKNNDDKNNIKNSNNENNCDENVFILPRKYLMLKKISLFLAILFIISSFFIYLPLFVFAIIFFFIAQIKIQSVLEKMCHLLSPLVISYLENECKNKIETKSNIKKKFNADDYVMKHLATLLQSNKLIFIENTKDDDEIWKLIN